MTLARSGKTDTAARASEARSQLAGHTIWLWHYLHADWQWEQSRAWHEDRYVLAVEEVLDLMSQDPEVTYYLDTAGEFLEPLLRKLGPRLDELRQRIAEGRIALVSGQVANARPNQVGDETYIRNLQMGRMAFQREFGRIDLSLFHSVDVAIGHSQMPQILRLVGFAHYRAWRPHGAMNIAGVPHQFWWEGLDGSRVLVTRGSYGGMYHQPYVPTGYAEDWEGTVARLFEHMLEDQLRGDRSPSGQLWMIQGSDDARPSRAWDGDALFDLPGLVAEWRRREDVPIRWGTPADFARAIEQHGEQLKTVVGALDGCDCSYNTANGGSNGLWARRQSNDRRLVSAERWAAIAAAVGHEYPEQDLQRLWRQHLTYQAHAQEFAFRDDFRRLIDIAEEVRLSAQEIEERALAAISVAAGGGTRAEHFVFNPHPWPVEADVELKHPFPAAGFEALSVVDEHGHVLPQQQLHQFRHPRYAGSVNEQRQLVRVPIPPTGYRRLAVRERHEPDPDIDGRQQDVLEAGGLRLTYRDGALREVLDPAVGHAYETAGGAPWPCVTFHELNDQNWLFRGPELIRARFCPAQGEWLESGPLRWRHRSSGSVGPYRAVIETVVSAGRRELAVDVELEGHWDEPERTGFVTMLAEVGPEGQITVDVPFGVESRDPERETYDGTPVDADVGDTSMFERLRPGFFWGRSWADWSGPGRGAAILSTNGCCYWLRDGVAIGHVLLRAVKRAPGTWEQHCGDHMTGSGRHQFSYVVRFHDGDWRKADPQRRSAELRFPPPVVRPDRPVQASLPLPHSFLALSGPALPSAYYRAGGSVVIRLYENEGRGGEVTLHFDRDLSRARTVDLLGVPVDAPVSVEGRQVRMDVRPWQIVTLEVVPR